MRAAVVERFGAAHESVKLTETVPRPLAPGEVRVRMLASAINPSDIVTISGAYPSRISLPFFPGYEGVGIVEEMGDCATELRIGSRVLPLGSAGCWQDSRAVEARWCFPVSDELTLEQAATMFINPATAWLMLNADVNIAARPNVVISAAASAIGCMMVRLLNLQGIEPIVTVRTARSAARLEGMRVRQILLSTAPHFKEDLALSSARTPMDVVLDAVGGPVGGELARCLRPGGLFVQYGLLSGVALPSDAFDASIKLKMFSLRDWIHRQPRDEIARLIATVERLVLEHTFDSLIAATYELESIQAALGHHEASLRSGKILLSIA